MSNTSRRSLLAGLSVAFVALAPAAIAAPSLAGTSELHILWNKRRALRDVYRASLAQVHAAEAAMPWWAQHGPDRLYADGTTGDRVCGWPAIRDMEPPTSGGFGAYRLLRPSKYDLRRNYDLNCSIWGDSPKLRASYRKGLRKLAVRLREQQAEHDKVGLQALYERNEAIVDETVRLADAIEALPDQTPDAVAAALMIELGYEATTKDDTGTNIQSIERALQIMRPSLTGNIAVDAADLLDNPDTSISDRMRGSARSQTALLTPARSGRRGFLFAKRRSSRSGILKKSANRGTHTALAR